MGPLYQSKPINRSPIKRPIIPFFPTALAPATPEPPHLTSPTSPPATTSAAFFSPHRRDPGSGIRHGSAAGAGNGDGDGAERGGNAARRPDRQRGSAVDDHGSAALGPADHRRRPDEVAVHRPAAPARPSDRPSLRLPLPPLRPDRRRGHRRALRRRRQCRHRPVQSQGLWLLLPSPFKKKNSKKLRSLSFF